MFKTWSPWNYHVKINLIFENLDIIKYLTRYSGLYMKTFWSKLINWNLWGYQFHLTELYASFLDFRTINQLISFCREVEICFFEGKGGKPAEECSKRVLIPKYFQISEYFQVSPSCIQVSDVSDRTILDYEVIHYKNVFAYIYMNWQH